MGDEFLSINRQECKRASHNAWKRKARQEALRQMVRRPDNITWETRASGLMVLSRDHSTSRQCIKRPNIPEFHIIANQPHCGKYSDKNCRRAVHQNIPHCGRNPAQLFPAGGRGEVDTLRSQGLGFSSTGVPSNSTLFHLVSTDTMPCRFSTRDVCGRDSYRQWHP